MTLPFQLHFHPHSSFDHYSSQTSQSQRQFPHLASQSPGKESPGSLQSGGHKPPSLFVAGQNRQGRLALGSEGGTSYTKRNSDQKKKKK